MHFQIKLSARNVTKTSLLCLGFLGVATVAPSVASATTTVCRCACRLGAVHGFHEACNKTYKSIDNGGYYCYDAGWDYKVQVEGTIDACLGVETQNVACAGWLVKTDDLFDNDPLYPIPATPVWLSGSLDTCIAD